LPHYARGTSGGKEHPARAIRERKKRKKGDPITKLGPPKMSEAGGQKFIKQRKKGKKEVPIRSLTFKK